MSLAAPGFSALACTIVTEPFSSFDQAEYVLYGEVTGYASSKRHCQENPLAPCEASWGLVLRVVKPVHLPSPNVREVELYSFGLESDCSRTTVDESSIHKVPVGTLMAVAAKELPQSQPGPAHDRIALDNWLRSVAVRLPPESNLSKLARSRFDYMCYRVTASPPVRDFEIRKDMLRLENAKSEAEVLEILFRLVECDAYFAEENSIVRQVARRYLKSSAARKQLEDRIAGTIALRDEADSDRQLDAILRRAREGSPLYELLAGIALVDKKEIDAGLKWMKRSARHGFYAALLYVGDIYDELHADALADEDAQKADSYERSSLNAYKLAAVKAQRAVTENEPLGFLVLGELYERGLGGLRQDALQAEQLYCSFLEYPNGWYPLTRTSGLESTRCGEVD